jgi:hypothetical protein
MSLVAIEGPIGTKILGKNPLARDDVAATGMRDKLLGPIAHLGPVLILYSHVPVGVGKRTTDRGWDRGRG